MKMLERVCREICNIEEVDPDNELIGLGFIPGIAEGQKYKKWEGYKYLVQPLIEKGYIKKWIKAPSSSANPSSI
jgi:hypothetical protein